MVFERARIGVAEVVSEKPVLVRRESGVVERGEGTVLGRYVVVETGAVVEGVEVGEGSVVEAGAVVGRGGVVGKVCCFFVCWECSWCMGREMG